MLTIEINRSSPVPLYAQLSDAVRSAILNGELAYNEKLPSENELTSQYGLSRMTVRSAMADLAAKKLIEKHQGRGAFVCYNRNLAPFTGNIDVLLDVSYTYFSGHYIRSISSVLSRRNYRFVIHDTWDDQQKIAEILEGILGSGSSGIILQPSHREEPLLPALADLLNRLSESGIPYLFLDRGIPGFPGARMTFDDYAGGKAAAEYLLSLEHRNIGMIACPEYYENAPRRDGFNAVLAENGLPPLKEIPAVGNWAESLPDLVRAGELTALFCYNDQMALTAMHALQKARLSIPKDVSVLGFDDTLLATASNPQMSSVIHPKDLLGERAAEKLLCMIEGTEYRSAPQPLAPLLHLRSSCGIARSSAR